VIEVIQDEFRDDPAADDFYVACGTGWLETLASLSTHLALASDRSEEVVQD
jgi:hypothetical protein